MRTTLESALCLSMRIRMQDHGWITPHPICVILVLMYDRFSVLHTGHFDALLLLNEILAAVGAELDQ